MNRGLLAALWLGLAVMGFSQASAPAPAPPVPTPAPAAPEEYEEEEFSPGLKALRRSEVILFGSLPLTLFLSYESYDIYRFFANQRQPQYAPWPFRRADAEPYQKWETTAVLVTALSASLAMAVTDYLIGKAIERAKRRSPDR